MQVCTVETFVPLAASGGIRTLADAEELFAKGADKVGINSSTFADENLIKAIADRYGSQAVIGSIHAKRIGESWECLIEQGREKTGVSVVDRISQLINQGAGELLVTSVDQDGVESGFDEDLAHACAAVTTVPLVIGGGCGHVDDVVRLSKIPGISGASIGSALHYNRVLIADLKAGIRSISESEVDLG